MDTNLVSKVLGIVVAILALVLAVGVVTFASGCMHDDGTVSVCHTAQLAIMGGAVVAALLSVVSIVVSSQKVSGAALLAAAACGVFAALAPGTIFPLCMMTTMRCHLVMQPFAQFLGIVIAAVAAIAGIRQIRARA